MEKILNRRDVLALAALAGVVAGSSTFAQDGAKALDAHSQDMMSIPADAPKIGMLIHPGMVALDLVGPMTVFNLLRWNVFLVWKDKSAVQTDLFPMTPTHAFADCPKDLDVLFVPGGIMGSIECMNDPDVIAFLHDRGSRARWVTSVCTGSLVLAGAGLLKGYDATSHWTTVDLLPLMGARHVNQRVVVDRNRMTGGGITAGIDFGLALAAKMTSEEDARKIQLVMEYAPAPPFKNGTPEEAGPERVSNLGPEKEWMDRQALTAAQKAAKRLGTL